jgi:hypothetical protein
MKRISSQNMMMMQAAKNRHMPMLSGFIFKPVFKDKNKKSSELSEKPDVVDISMSDDSDSLSSSSSKQDDDIEQII